MLTNQFKIKKVKSNNNYAQYEMGPLMQGLGHSIAVPLRRMLISKIKGTCVTAVKIKGLSHEFSTIDGVKEDVLNIILNLQKVIFSIDSSEKEIVKLKVSGVGKFYASSLQLPFNVKVVNPDAYIVELTDEKAKLELEAIVEVGYGFQLKDDSIRNTEPGVIPLNKAFSPVVKVNYDVKSTIVDQSTSYENLIFEIWTNGSITPDNALGQAIDNVFEIFSKLKLLLNDLDEKSS